MEFNEASDGVLSRTEQIITDTEIGTKAGYARSGAHAIIRAVRQTGPQRHRGGREAARDQARGGHQGGSEMVAFSSAPPQASLSPADASYMRPVLKRA
jgi:hypothetical protein